MNNGWRWLFMARNKYPEVTVEKILEVSQRLFMEKGYDNTTIQDIVNELGGLRGRSIIILNQKRKLSTHWGKNSFLIITRLLPFRSRRT